MKTGNKKKRSSSTRKKYTNNEDDKAGNMSKLKWANIKHTKEFASKVRVRDTSVGYSALDVYIVIFLPLFSYGMYLIYCETCRIDILETYPHLILTAVHEMTSLNVSIKAISLFFTIFVIYTTFYFARKPRKVYCIDFVTYKGPPELRVTREKYQEIQETVDNYEQESIDFQMRVLDAGKIGPNTTFPASVINATNGKKELNMAGSRTEAKEVMCKTVQDLMIQNNVNANDIDILIVNCSLFCPTPSLASMIIKEFNFRSDILSFNLGGMGCSAGVISIDLAKRLLQSSGFYGMKAIVVSTENITQNWYRGNEKSMLLSNCLFRQGCAAVLLSNSPKHAKLELVHSIRTHRGQYEEAYQCVYQCQDTDGYQGVRLSRQVMRIAGEALTQNIVNLGPLVLPWSEQIRFFLNVIARKLINKKKSKQSKQNRGIAAYVSRNVLIALFKIPFYIGDGAKYLCGGVDNVHYEDGDYKIDPYVPNFESCFDHFCVHAGGRAVLDAIEKSLNLSSEKREQSRNVLYNYGNVSSASIWYEMEYVLNECDIHSGQTVWQIAFGSGFKCNSAVWKILKNKK